MIVTSETANGRSRHGQQSQRQIRPDKVNRGAWTTQPSHTGLPIQAHRFTQPSQSADTSRVKNEIAGVPTGVTMAR